MQEPINMQLVPFLFYFPPLCADKDNCTLYITKLSTHVATSSSQTQTWPLCSTGGEDWYVDGWTHGRGDGSFCAVTQPQGCLYTRRHTHMHRGEIKVVMTTLLSQQQPAFCINEKMIFCLWSLFPSSVVLSLLPSGFIWCYRKTGF